MRKNIKYKKGSKQLKKKKVFNKVLQELMNNKTKNSKNMSIKLSQYLHGWLKLMTEKQWGQTRNGKFNNKKKKNKYKAK